MGVDVTILGAAQRLVAESGAEQGGGGVEEGQEKGKQTKEKLGGKPKTGAK